MAAGVTKSDLPAHEVARLAARDFELNGQRCLAKDGDFAGPRWILDDERNQCKGCCSGFDTFNRRHHCRYCGDVFCKKCTEQKYLLPSRFRCREPQRVCKSCTDILLPQQTQLIREIANHNTAIPVDFSSDVRYWNLPYAKSLDMEISKAAYSLFNLRCLEMVKDGSVSMSLLQKARGLAFITVAKGGVIFAPRFGTGLILSRLADGRWSAPSAIATVGLSWGALIGADVTDYMIVMHDYHSLRALMGDGQVSIGGEVKLSMAGIGRTASAQIILGEGGYAVALSYCHSKGFFAGVSLDGSVIVPRHEVNRDYYGHAVTPYDLLSGAIEPPNGAKSLYTMLEEVVDKADAMGGIGTSLRYENGQKHELAPLTSGHNKTYVNKKGYAALQGDYDLNPHVAEGYY